MPRFGSAIIFLGAASLTLAIAPVILGLVALQVLVAEPGTYPVTR